MIRYVKKASILSEFFHSGLIDGKSMDGSAVRAFTKHGICIKANNTINEHIHSTPLAVVHHNMGYIAVGEI
jgi:hypothetical protein